MQTVTIIPVRGDFSALKAIVLALFDLIWNITKITKISTRLTQTEYQEYHQLPETQLYWQAKNSQKIK